MKTGIDAINENPEMLQKWIINCKKVFEEYIDKNPDSLIPDFVAEIKSLGFEFDVYNQIIGFMPKHKKEILPVAIRYYEQAKMIGKTNEQLFFMTFFRFKGFDEVVPMLLENFNSDAPYEIRISSGEALYEIRSKEYAEDYIKILSNPLFGESRAMIVLLVGKLKINAAAPVLIKLLDDEKLRSRVITALGCFKSEEFRPYFERFINSSNNYWRKYSLAAIKKLDHKTGDLL